MHIHARFTPCIIQLGSHGIANTQDVRVTIISGHEEEITGRGIFRCEGFPRNVRYANVCITIRTTHYNNLAS